MELNASFVLDHLLSFAGKLTELPGKSALEFV